MSGYETYRFACMNYERALAMGDKEGAVDALRSAIGNCDDPYALVTLKGLMKQAQEELRSERKPFSAWLLKRVGA